MPDPAPPDGPERPEAAPEHLRPLAQVALGRRKRRDAAVILPLAALLLFASPVLDVVVDAGRLFGLPVGVLFVFGAWFALIAATARLAPALWRDGGADDAGP